MVLLRRQRVSAGLQGIRSSLAWNVTQRRLLVTDVSGQSTAPIFMGGEVEKVFLKMGPIGCPETSVTIKLRFLTSQKKRRAHLYHSRIVKDMEINLNFKEFAISYPFFRNVGYFLPCNLESLSPIDMKAHFHLNC